MDLNLIKHTTFSIFFFFISIILYGQENVKSSKQKFETPRNGLSIDIDFLSAEFAGTFSAGNYSKFGVAFQIGAGVRIILNNPTYLYCGGGCDYGDCCSVQDLKAAYFAHNEFGKLKLFYRQYIKHNTFINTGIFASYGRLIGGDISNSNIFTGVHIDFYTGWDKIKFGLKTQEGISFMKYKTNSKKTNYFMMTITPALQIQF